jgi:intergrase/recombinase
MANMSYCRFENTLIDLQDCISALENRDITNNRERNNAKTLLRNMAEFLVNEDLINLDEEECLQINYAGIEELVNECE